MPPGCASGRKHPRGSSARRASGCGRRTARAKSRALRNEAEGRRGIPLQAVPAPGAPAAIGGRRRPLPPRPATTRGWARFQEKCFSRAAAHARATRSSGRRPCRPHAGHQLRRQMVAAPTPR
eukprot:3399024-Prymnesium_polylepis.1